MTDRWKGKKQHEVSSLGVGPVPPGKDSLRIYNSNGEMNTSPQKDVPTFGVVRMVMESGNTSP